MTPEEKRELARLLDLQAKEKTEQSELAAIVQLISLVSKRELALWLRPTDEELERLWDERIDREIDRMQSIFGDDGR